VVPRVNSALPVFKKTKLSQPSRKTPGVIGTEVIYQDSEVYEIRQVMDRCFQRFLCMVGAQHHSNRFSIEHDLERTSVRGVDLWVASHPPVLLAHALDGLRRRPSCPAKPPTVLFLQ